jgi:hypothetical protein
MIKMKKLISSLVIASGALFITALLPTKANAVSLTFTPTGTQEKKPDDSITFSASLNPMGAARGINFVSFSYDYDGNEISLDTEDILPKNTLITNTVVVAKITFKVLQGVKKDQGGSGDFFSVRARYTNASVEFPISSNDTVDVVPKPVPEPLTIFGTATALGCGVLFKRKSSKKTVS